MLVLDAGGAPGGASPYDRAKFAAILRGEVELLTAVHNIGAAELELGAEELRRLADETRIPFVSSNVRQHDGSELAPAHRVITIGDRRIAVFGVLSPKLVRGNWQVEEPREALLHLLPKLPEKPDTVVVLAYLPGDELAALAGSLPEVDLVVGGPTLQSVAPKRAGPTVWAAATNKGKFVVQLTQSRPGAEWTGKIVELGPELADSVLQMANLKRFRDDLERTDFTATQTSFAPTLPSDLPKDFRIAGTTACQKCHVDDCLEWDVSRHGHAWQTLVDKQAFADPYCQHCHTTGYGWPDGFQSLASANSRGNVGCESCHGPSLAHTLKPQIKTLYDARDRCIHCHDHENSPQFKYDKYWDRIAHGQAVSHVEVKKTE